VLDWSTFPRLFQPISLLYAFLPPGLAYAVTEAGLLLLAYFGMWRLMRISGLPPNWLVCFLAAFGMSFSSYGAGIAAAPLLLSIILSSGAVRRWEAVLAFLIGLNTTLVLHGLFLPPAMVAAILMLGQRVDLARLMWVGGAFMLGTLATSIGLFWAIFDGAPSHRDDWVRFPSETVLSDIFLQTLANIMTMGSASSSFLTPALYVPVILTVALFAGGLPRRAALWLIAFVALAMTLKIAEPFIAVQTGGPIGSIQWHRLILFAPLLALILAGLVLASGRGRKLMQPVMGISLVFAFLAGIGLRPAALEHAVPTAAVSQVKTLLREDRRAAAVYAAFDALTDVEFKEFLAGIETWDRHFLPHRYNCLREALKKDSGAGRVLSYGPDPMIASFHEIPVIDGYHNYYPLSYKRTFRTVIEATLEVSPSAAAYFDGWGSRVYTKFDRGNDMLPDLSAAVALGATHVISDEQITTPGYVPVVFCDGLTLFQIAS